MRYRNRSPFMHDLLSSMGLSDFPGFDTRMEFIERVSSGPPNYSVAEKDGTATIWVDFPGCPEPKVTIEEGMLCIEADRKNPIPEDYVTRHAGLGGHKRIEKFTLGENYDTDSVTAKYVHGVLIVTFGLKEPIKGPEPKRVDVKL